MTNTVFDWSELAFANKKAVKDLRATFIAAPRQLSSQRFKQLVKTYLPSGNIVLGIAKEPFIAGFDDQPQFATLKASDVQSVVDQVNRSSSPHKIYVLHYFQPELPHLLAKLGFKRAVLVNGSWQHVFHSSEAFYSLISEKIPYELVSPFSDETEAKAFEAKADKQIAKQLAAQLPAKGTICDDHTMLQLANLSAKQSYDYSFQTGLALGQPVAGKAGQYRFVTTTFNRVVPYQTYAMLHGASRETHFSPPQDMNHYDTVHAEVAVILAAQAQNIDLKGATIFINLMPCAACARMLTQTPIKEVVYTQDHSAGYAVTMLIAAGKTVRRLI